MVLYPDQSHLQRLRTIYQPSLPPILTDLSSLQAFPVENQEVPLEDEIHKLFPLTVAQPNLIFKRVSSERSDPLKIGVVFSGGQAPGGHNVIAGLLDAMLKLNRDSRLIGFLDGPNGLTKNNYTELTSEMIAPYRNQGGFDLIGSGRSKIETAEQFEALGKNVRALKLDGLVIIGGDDSNTNAAFLAEYFKRKGLDISIIGVPKTIDGDLKNRFIETSFGYDTACKIYSEIIGNLAKDALSARKYYFFVKLMGRSASHVTLECAVKTQINLALIGEEVSALKLTLPRLIDQIADMICLRAARGKNHGVILIPEGIIEFIEEFKYMIQELNRLLSHSGNESEADRISKIDLIIQALTTNSATCFSSLPEEFQKQLLIDRDPHGNIQVSKIETERLFICLVEKELVKRKNQGNYIGAFNPQPLFCGYEGRSGLPSNFDCHYCYSLGHVAALLINSRVSGYMACIQNLGKPVSKWEINGISLTKMLHLEDRKGILAAVIRKGPVDLEGTLFNYYKEKRSAWLLEDHYCCPGPIQYEGDLELVDAPPLSLTLPSNFSAN